MRAALTESVTAAVRVLVTRPLADAQRWTEALRARGIAADSLPLIDIAPLADTAPLQSAWRGMADLSAVMFVSANAVQHFMAARPLDADLQGLQTQAWGTGPGTQAALLAAGWPSQWIRCPAPDAETFDSEALWALVQDEVQGWAGRRVLIVRGANAQGQLAGRDWLATQLETAGVPVVQCVAYQRRAPVPSAAQRAQAQVALHDGSWWLFSSSEAAQHLVQACPGLDVGQARALATHPRIAQRLLQAGWGRVDQVPAGLAAQALSIKSLP